MPRLFLSHSSKDNVAALAVQRWLIGQDWAKEGIVIDLHGIGAGERWRDTLRKANAACEAVLLLASPDSLDSQECQREINLAEDLGKEIIVAILRDMQKSDPRLARWGDRQFVDLSAVPQERMEPFEHEGQLHRVPFHLPALQSIAARLAHLGIAPGSFAWEPRKLPDGVLQGPYPGGLPLSGRRMPASSSAARRTSWPASRACAACARRGRRACSSSRLPRAPANRVSCAPGCGRA